MHDGERLSAYLAGELDDTERAQVEADLARDPALRASMQRLREVDAALRRLPPVEPPPGFSARLREAVAEEVARGDAATGPPPARLADAAVRRAQRRDAPWRALGQAAAAAAVIAVVGVGAGVLLRAGGPDQGTDLAGQAAAPAGRPGLTVVETDNDYDDRELQRLAVNVDLGPAVPPGMTAEEAESYSAEALQLHSRTGETAADGAAASAEQDDGAEEGTQLAGRAQAPVLDRLRESLGAAADDVQRCLPEIVESAATPLVPVLVEVARYRGEPAIVYVFAAEEPSSRLYRRVEVWAVGRRDCQVLSFAQYDRG